MSRSQKSANSPEDTGDSRVGFVPGSGLVSRPRVGVVFTEGNALPLVVEALAETRKAIGLSIDEASRAVPENRGLKRVLGLSVFKIVLTGLVGEPAE